jgi:hypothetical protein
LEFFKAIMCTRTQDKMCNRMHLSVPKWLCPLIFFPLVGIFWHVIDVFVLVEFGKSKFKLGAIQKLFRSSLDLSFVTCKELSYNYNCIK